MSKLTSDQEKALKLLLDSKKIFILQGYAGTGKSFLLDHYLDAANNQTVVTAPTHKAVAVVDGDSTIHSYLGLKLANKKDKKVLIPSGRSRINYGETVVIDEASMISSELLEYILEYQRQFNLKVIFVGDPGQIPPVGEAVSPAWDLKSDTFTLTQIVRQAADNPIISLASLTRTTGCKRKDILEYTDGANILSGNLGSAKEFFTDNVDGDDFPQILSHKNAVVDSLNTWARNEVRDNPEEPYLIGEEVYIRSTGKHSPFSLEEIVKIYRIGRPYPYRSDPEYPVNVMELDVGRDSRMETLVVPCSEKDTNNFETNKYLLASQARKDKKKWQRFWEYSEFISVVKHIYAMTCHRSQGSTFKDTIVNFKDIKCNRLLYTAITRASDRVFFII